MPVARAIRDKDILANGLLNNGGSVSSVPIRRGQDPLTSTVLDMRDVVRDDILDLKTQVDNAAGSFVKNMYSKHGQIETKRALNLPSSGPKAKEAIEDANDVVDFAILLRPGTWTGKPTNIVKRSA